MEQIVKISEKGCYEEALILATVAMLGRNNKQSDI
jgi:hypothetical protein